MKHLKGIKLKRFVKKYFKEYGNDIKKVTYITYKNKIEYLINDHYIYIKKRNQKWEIFSFLVFIII